MDPVSPVPLVRKGCRRKFRESRTVRGEALLRSWSTFFVGGLGQDFPDRITAILVRLQRQTIRFDRVKDSKNSRCVGLLLEAAGAMNPRPFLIVSVALNAILAALFLRPGPDISDLVLALQWRPSCRSRIPISPSQRSLEALIPWRPCSISCQSPSVRR